MARIGPILPLFYFSLIDGGEGECGRQRGEERLERVVSNSLRFGGKLLVSKSRSAGSDPPVCAIWEAQCITMPLWH